MLALINLCYKKIQDINHIRATSPPSYMSSQYILPVGHQSNFCFVADV